jgi:hypothetical protein
MHGVSWPVERLGTDSDDGVLINLKLTNEESRVLPALHASSPTRRCTTCASEGC